MPNKEGRIRPEQSIWNIWRGEPWPREIILLDNDFFGQPDWRARIAEIRDGRFAVSFTQGINARCLTDEAAEAIASVDYRNDSMDTRRIYTAWDNRGDEDRLFAGLNRLVKYGVKPDHIMVYMLVGYWPAETQEDRDYRRRRLREFGARPYPMPYYRTPELIGFQRWVVGPTRRGFLGRTGVRITSLRRAGEEEIVSKYSELTTVLTEERYLVEALQELGYAPEVCRKERPWSVTWEMRDPKRHTSSSGDGNSIQRRTTSASRVMGTESTRRSSVTTIAESVSTMYGWGDSRRPTRSGRRWPSPRPRDTCSKAER